MNIGVGMQLFSLNANLNANAEVSVVQAVGIIKGLCTG